ncbi:hypothetical protein BDR22DRAFT_194157 [Usnea florida]
MAMIVTNLHGFLLNYQCHHAAKNRNLYDSPGYQPIPTISWLQKTHNVTSVDICEPSRVPFSWVTMLYSFSRILLTTPRLSSLSIIYSQGPASSFLPYSIAEFATIYTLVSVLTRDMASLTFEFPKKSEENRKAGNVCEYCRGTSNYRYLAANRLRNGIVHLSVEMVELAKKNGSRCTQQDAIRWWLALIEVACKKDCGCAQNLRSQVDWEGFALFWSQTKIEFTAGERLSRQQKKNLAKKAKAANPKTEDDTASAPAPAPAPARSKNHLANERRKKKNKVRQQAAKALAGDLGGDIGSLEEALPPILPPAPQAALPVDPVLGLPITFTATLAVHPKPVPQ